MAVTITFDAGLNTNKKITSWSARGKKMAAGAINFSGLTYADGGITADFAGLSTIDMMFISPQRGIVFEFDYTNNKIVMLVPGTASATATILSTADGVRMLEIASDTALSTFTSVRFFAVGS